MVISCGAWPILMPENGTIPKIADIGADANKKFKILIARKYIPIHDKILDTYFCCQIQIIAVHNVCAPPAFHS